MPRLRQSCQNLCSETKGDVPPPNPSRKKSPLLKGQLELHTFPLIKNVHRLVRPRWWLLVKLTNQWHEYDCAVVANRFDRATFHRFFAERFLLRGLWLLVNVGMTPVVVAFETPGCRFAAQIAVDALIIYIECPRYVFGVFVCDIGHSFYGKSEIHISKN